MRIALAIFALIVASPTFGQSNNDVEVLTKKEQAARQKADAIEAERVKVRKNVSTLKSSLAKTARETQIIEKNLISLEHEIQSLTDRSESLTTQIQSDRKEYLNLLAALQRIEATPPPTLALTPSNANRAAKAGQLITTVSNQLRGRADALALNLKASEVTQAQLELKKTKLSQTRKRLSIEIKSINSGLADKTKLESKLAEEKQVASAEADRLAAESKTLLELIAKLESQASEIVPRKKPGKKPAADVVLPKGTTRFADAKGAMLRPVSGQIIKSYGRGEKGMTFAGRSNGKVLAPYAGRIEFSGPFKNYDNVVILNVGDGYFVLLTGLDSLYVDAGDSVKRGEPVGEIPARSGAEIYIELRKNGSPVNPKPWLAASDVKSG